MLKPAYDPVKAIPRPVILAIEKYVHCRQLGKLIAPQPIENKLKANVLVGNAALVGDKHKFACVLLSPNFAALKGWAEGQGIATADPAALVKDPRVVKAYQEIVDAVNLGLAHFESMKRMKVVPEEWSVRRGR